MIAARAVFDLIRQALERGESIEIEGLGCLWKTGAGYGFTPQIQPEVFVAYVEEDLAAARRICAALRRGGCSPWLDKDKLLAGQNWPRALRRAIEASDVFVACFSRRSTSKCSQFHNELRLAMECARRLPLDSTFVIPVRLEPCEVPGRLADELQWVDLFPEREAGIRRLLRAIRRAIRQHRPSRARARVVA